MMRLDEAAVERGLAEEGAPSSDGVVSLGDVLAQRKAPPSGRCSVFVSLGLGVEDGAAAAALVRAAAV
jgi:ornithine cyclodeaminase/alanine dehydrogenase-like protein (mu-crystallin family)